MIELPSGCPRERDDCQPLHRVSSDDRESFICCGMNDGTTRADPEDEFRVCWKNEAIDDISDWDRRDIIDTVSVMTTALSVAENMALEMEEAMEDASVEGRIEDDDYDL